MCELPILLASGLALWAKVAYRPLGCRESNPLESETRGAGRKFVGWGSFCCSGQHQETRQAKDHPKAAYEAWHTAWRYPFRARRDWQSQAHLHTTLNKSRDEKLEIVGV